MERKTENKSVDIKTKTDESRKEKEVRRENY